jgi:hypothetical protein
LFLASGCDGCRPFQHDQLPIVIGQVLHPDLHRRAGDADGADELSAHAMMLDPKHMLDARPDFGAGFVGRLLPRGQRLVPQTALVDMAALSKLSGFGFSLFALVGAISPYAAGRVIGIKHIFQLLAVMHRGRADDVAILRRCRVCDAGVGRLVQS